jgi:opacity protein-like surface antigen
MRHAILSVLFFAACAVPAAAQPYVPPSSGPSIGLRGFAVIDTTRQAANESFAAVLGRAQTTAVGGGAEVDAWKHLFLRFAVSQSKETGSRVFVSDGEVFDLGIPLSVTLTPIEAGGGWRFPSASRVTPYLGAAFVSLGFTQVSKFAEPDEDVHERYTGSAAFGGVDVAIWKGLFVGAEAQYRHVSVPDASGSVMREFGERDLGGFTARILFGVGTR